MFRMAGFLILCSLWGAFPAKAGEIRLSVAASLADAVTEICADYARENPGTTCLTNFGASGTLARQIAAGAPAELFLSANPKWVDFLVEEKRIPADAIRVLAANALVFVGPRGRASSMADLPKLQRIALGNPRSVPAGEYAEAAMKKAGIFDQLTVEGKLVMAQDVRQALVYADRGEVDGAFVYLTDARLARDVSVLFQVPKGEYPTINYLMALTESASSHPDARAFFDYLQSAEAGMTLKKFGFVLE